MRAIPSLRTAWGCSASSIRSLRRRWRPGRDRRDLAKKVYPDIKVEIIPIVNDFFGHTIDVAGLITGRDLIAQLRGRDLGERVYITNRMLKDGENVFLDDVTVDDAAGELGVPVVPMENGGEPLLKVFLS